MEIKWLEDFLMLAQMQNFSRAAEERHITQSAFSRRIKSLEDWVGEPLVNRNTYPATLTPVGEQFRETAVQVVRQLYDAREVIRHHEKAESSTLTFAALHTLSMTFFPKWLKSIENRLGQLNTRLTPEIRTLESYVLALTEGNCDFLLCFSHPSMPILIDQQQFPHIVLGTEPIIPIINADSPLELPGSSDNPIPFLRYAPYSFLGQCLSSKIKNADTKPHLKTLYENSMAEGLKEMLLESEAIAWLPESLITKELNNGTLVRAGTEDWDIVVEIRLYRSNQNSRPIVEKFWASAQASQRPQIID